MRIAYAARQVEGLQVIYLDAKGETKRDEEASEDNAARFVACMRQAGAANIRVFPAISYNGWLGDPVALKKRLLSVIDYTASPYYGDAAANALELALPATQTLRNSRDFIANLDLKRLQEIHKDDPVQYRRVKQLDKQLLQQVEMRYQVFFDAMRGQLDGPLSYQDADAVYLRVRGFALRAEAPRLGRFLVSDFLRYIESRRKAGLLTLFIIDEVNALRLREELGSLFEQCRSFGGCLVISAQGYHALGPTDIAKRILDSCSTCVVHSCSDPGPILERVGKRFTVETTWIESDEDGAAPRRNIRAGLASPALDTPYHDGVFSLWRYFGEFLVRGG